MSQISLRSSVKTPSNILVLTTRFVNEFGLPDKVNDYIQTELKKEGKKSLAYNYIGKYVSILIIDPKKEKNSLLEEIRKHGAKVADGLNANKHTEIYIYNQTRSPDLSLSAAEGVSLGNYQFLKHT